MLAAVRTIPLVLSSFTVPPAPIAAAAAFRVLLASTVKVPPARPVPVRVKVPVAASSMWSKPE